MTSLHPALRPIPVLIFTPSGWIRGTFHVPEVQSFLSFLNHQDELLKLTEVLLPGSKQGHPFLGLYKSAMLLVVPQGDPKELKPLPQTGPRESRLVTCLFGLGSIRGRLEVAEIQRISDFLLRRPGFMELRHCHVGPNPFLHPEETLGEAIPLVYVNTHALIGTAEEDSTAKS